MPTRAPSFRPPGAPTKNDHHREHNAKRPGSTRPYGRTWRRLRLLVLHEEPLCRTPGCGQLATDVDHIVALAKGGTNDRDNLQALCHACHTRKTNRFDKRLKVHPSDGQAPQGASHLHEPEDVQRTPSHARAAAKFRGGV